ncbi:MAG: 5-formyltetrahydrofolate cyclo-ligase [Myxococcota bacterium]|nr:5-formyltetrahydrofolate cyclo-ligase [Myxococcota bacterium]MDW8362604.1 5-formyltetrahydrofolate cyclo-ligase [Myxococcales bacterium]
MTPDDVEHGLRVAAKRVLRERALATRRLMPPEARARRSARIVEAVLGLPEWASAATVALYAPLPTEPDVTPLIETARAVGKRVALPRVDGEMLRMHEVPRDPATMTRSALGVLEPPDHGPAIDVSELDLVVVPALGADPSGGRLGRGRGFYDRFLRTLVPGRTLRVAVVYEFELVPELPLTEHDVRVDRVVSCRGVLRAFRDEDAGAA